jgi:hypothetical protein
MKAATALPKEHGLDHKRNFVYSGDSLVSTQADNLRAKVVAVSAKYVYIVFTMTPWGEFSKNSFLLTKDQFRNSWWRKVDASPSSRPNL